MNKLGLLLKNYFKCYIGSFTKKKKKKEYLSGGVIALLIGALFVFLFVSMAISTINQFIELGSPETALYVLTTTGITFMFLIVVIKGTSTARSSDTDLLMSLPIKKVIIVLSKILKDYLFDLISLLLIMFPTYVCYYVMVADASIQIIFFGLIVILLLTCFSNAISVILNTVIAKISRKFRFAEILQTIITTIITIGFIGVYYFINVYLTSSPEFAEYFLTFKPIMVIVNCLLGKDFISYLWLSLVAIIPFMCAVMIKVHDFNHQKNYSINVNKEIVYKQKKIWVSLFKKEVSRYFRSTVYVTNTIIGGLFIILFAGMVIGFGIDRIEAMFITFMPNADYLFASIEAIIVCLLTILAGSVITTSAAISLEGKHFWILKAHPIAERDIFIAKVMLNLVIGGVPIIISSIILSFVIGFEYLVFLLILPFLSLIFASMVGLYCNLKYHKLDWKDEQEVIKQGLAVILALGLAIIPSVILLVIYLTFLINIVSPIIYLVLAVVVLLGIDLLMYRLLMTKGIKMFKAI